MSFEIHLASITTGSLSLGHKNPWDFCTYSWGFKNVKKKPVLSPVALQPFPTYVTYYVSRASKYTHTYTYSVDNSRAPLGLNLLGSRTPYEIT